MKKMLVSSAILVISGIAAMAQGTADDYNRAYSLASKFTQSKVLNTVQRVQWTENGSTLYYQTNTASGPSFVSINAEKGTRKTYATQEAMFKDLGIKAPGESPFGQRPQASKFGPQEPHWATVDEENEMMPVLSPDGKTEAYVQNCNVVLHTVGTSYADDRIISRDGTLGNYYSNRIYWSPDSRKIFVCKRRPVSQKRYVTLVESSPAGQTQPRTNMLEYAKPGDELPQFEPVIFDIESGKQVFTDNSRLANQFELGGFQWSNDSKEVMIEYNQRGHQLYQLLAMNAADGSLRTIVEEKASTFVNWTRIYRNYLENGKELLWTSERDNWNHLYLVNIQNPSDTRLITKGDWCVRDIINIDEQARRITFTASGMNPEEDPYLIHYYSIGFDGSNLVSLTPANGNHRASFSPDGRYVIDTYSLVDQAPVTELRSAADGKLIATLEKADISPLEAEGWVAPERFVAPGRDGKTLMYGIIQRPVNFDPSKKYPVIEYIYSGPGDAYTRKDFRPYDYDMTALAELGFIVVQLDGMGTSWRGKKFEEICYKNLKDSGFLDRKAWIRAAAAKYPYMDADNVGIFGCSAGGQEAAAAVLFHGDFYKAAYSACGCHDNRMDKIWWNEQWMGYPVDESYEECSNVANAWRLERPLMLVVGEIDDNVDPSSTYQVVNALEKAGKDFELVLITGAHHTMGGDYGDHKRYDFFVRNLLGVNPPKWSEVKTK